MNLLITYTLRIVVAASMLSCATYPPQATLLTITTREESVVFQRSSEVTSFEVTAVLRNDDARTLYVDSCFGETQREIDGVWTTVYLPFCLGATDMTIKPGDSVVLPITVRAFTTTPPTQPTLDPRMGAGRYRLLFGVDLKDPKQGPTDLNERIAVPSSTFMVID
ncbi:MAG: hypothetical protein H7Z74_00320 [Anaerolineae bacterium]|nr:hypothetical protein [Gemmatimonadaceae bacterium]